MVMDRFVASETTGHLNQDIFQEIKHSMSKYHLSFDQFREVSSDGAPALVESKFGLVAKITADLNPMNLDANDLCVFHCAIQQQYLCTKW
jgi:hypothetical protein